MTTTCVAGYLGIPVLLKYVGSKFENYELLYFIPELPRVRVELLPVLHLPHVHPGDPVHQDGTQDQADQRDTEKSAQVVVSRPQSGWQQRPATAAAAAASVTYTAAAATAAAAAEASVPEVQHTDGIPKISCHDNACDVAGKMESTALVAWGDITLAASGEP